MMAPGELDIWFRPIAQALGIDHTLQETLYLFLIVFARWFPVIVLTPFLGGRLVPAPIKVALALLFSLFMLPWIGRALPGPLELSSGTILVHIGIELIIGLVIGFSIALLFWGADMAGRYIDTLRGTTIANALIPQVRTQTSLLGNFYFQLFVVLYVGAGGHRFFIDRMFRSFQFITPLKPGIELSGVAQYLITYTAHLFTLLIQIIAPAFVAVMFLDVLLGVANRMSPGLDVFFLSLSLKSALATLALALSLWTLYRFFPGSVQHFHVWFQKLIHAFGV